MKKAISQYESLLDKLPNNFSVLNNIAYLLADNDERLSDAVEYAKRAWQLRPNDPSVLDTYAYALYKTGEYEKASEYLQAAKQQFAGSADGWLIAFADVNGDIVVTHEVYDPDIKKRVPIPNVCLEFDVQCCNTFDMIRELNEQFVLKTRRRR